MNEQKIDALQIVLNSEVVMTALKEVFAEEVEEARPQGVEVEDSVLGQKYRAYTVAKKIVSDAFIRLQTHQKPSGSKPPKGRHI